MKFMLLFALLAVCNAADGLKIYVFEVGQCDSQLVVFPSGFSMLIDAGEPAGTTAENGVNAAYIAKRVESILGKKEIDIFVLSHYHIDHMGGYEVGGIWYLLEKGGFTFGKFLKRNIGTYKGSSMSECKKSAVTWKYVGPMSEKTAKFVCYSTATGSKTKLSKVAENAHRCNKEQIVPPDTGAQVTVLIRDALGVKDSDGKALSRNSMSESVPVAENDFSICMRIQYGDFVYSTCGDLSGYYWKKATFAYHDVETSVADMMGSVDVYHVNHHGSKSATNEKWCSVLTPTVSVISCGGGSLPVDRPLKNLKAINSQVYTTGTDCHQSAIVKYDNIIQMGDDVVISYTKGAKTFTVASAAGKNSKTFNVKLNKASPAACKLLEE